jgi:protein-tyrosine-phosphatase
MERSGASVERGSPAVPQRPGGVLPQVRKVARRLLMRLEQRRAEAVRRRPGPVTRRLRSARTVLILCQGNVSRSVFAAHVLATALKGVRAITIRSAGLGTEPGWRAHPRVVAGCAARDIDVRGHASVAVTAAMIKAADVVFVMEVAQLVEVTRRFWMARRKTFLLTSLAPEVPMDIEDPAGKPDATVDACLDHVGRALKPLIEVLVRRETAAA